MTSNEQQEVRKLHSFTSQVHSTVVFANKTGRCVAIDWLNFEGQHVSYCPRLAPGKARLINTFVGHPWLFYDSDSRHQLVTLPNHQPIYFPTANVNGRRFHQVEIINPLLPLRQICLQSIHRHLSVVLGHREKGVFVAKIAELGLPRIFHEDLIKLLDDQNNNDIPIYIVPDD